MKILYYTLIIALFSFADLWGQWTPNGSNIYNTNLGNVGIGTADPSEKLHINGNFFMNAGEGFKILGDQNFFGQFQDGIIFQMEDVNATGGNTDGGFVFRGYTPTDGLSRDWMVIKSGGNVGVGTTTPSQKLEVNGNIMTSSGSGGTLTLFDSDANRRNRIILGADGNGAYVRSTWNEFGTDAISFRNSVGDQVMTITGDDKVGIGTTAPDARLAVKGNIHAQEIKLDLNGAVAPDFVFAPEYTLRTLAETEKYIKQNKHLPEIPSAAEMEQNGIQLKEMNLKLLQKIEELTLYAISQEKTLKQQQKHIEKLAAQNEKLVKRIETIENK